MSICIGPHSYHTISPNLNIVIEWDEDSHYENGELMDKDKHRQSEIIKALKCDFYRIKQSEFVLG
ncbi:hypothetical protein HOB87_00850 [Candidatus Woesearchaeota archaeon]|jgi:hypothetical protein|nr:hypothetical protein [Candidatus Woesearchaeota archaeon]